MFRKLRFTIMLMVCVFAAVSSVAQLAYVKNITNAFSLAEGSGKTVILYTGRADHFTNNNPRSFFFDCILAKHPDLAVRSNKYVVCEQFLYGFDSTPDAKSTGLLRRFGNYAYLYEKYELQPMWIALTFLDAKGNKLNGPFLGSRNSIEFSSSADCYEELADYLQADPALTPAQAQSNLVSHVFAVAKPESFGLFRYERIAKGGEGKIFLESGTYSTRYKVGSPVAYACRKGTIQRGRFSADGYDESLIALTGSFVGAPPFEGEIFIRMNDVYFRGTFKAVGTQPDHVRDIGGVSVEAGEYALITYVRDDSVARALLKELVARLSSAEKSK